MIHPMISYDISCDSIFNISYVSAATIIYHLIPPVPVQQCHTFISHIQGVFFTGTPPKSSKYKKVSLG